MTSRLSCALAAAAVVSLTGCGAHGPRIPASEAKGLVLQQSDLPPGFSSLGEGTQNPLDPSRSDPRRHGRTAGWYADYRRVGGAETRGPLIVQSRVDLFKDPGGAAKEIGTYKTRFENAARDGSGRRIELAGLGKDGQVLSEVSAGAPGAQLFTIVWRRANAAAAVVVTGLRGKLSLAQSLTLARKQDRRLASAAG